MTIILGAKLLHRVVEPVLAQQLRAMPAVAVTGARQTGKSTLAERLAPGSRRYHSLDDLDVLDASRRDLEALVGGASPVTIDEIQREQDLLGGHGRRDAPRSAR